jgi:predicted RNA-binding protein YlqC (UPF0109 family)
MASWKIFRLVTEALSDNLPDDAQVEAIQAAADYSTITIWTSTPGNVVGRRGTTAESIRRSLETSLDAQVRLHVQEVTDSPDEVDLFDEGLFYGDDPLGGVLEPRSPKPVQPSGADQLDLPRDNL